MHLRGMMGLVDSPEPEIKFCVKNWIPNASAPSLYVRQGFFTLACDKMFEYVEGYLHIRIDWAE